MNTTGDPVVNFSSTLFTKPSFSFNLTTVLPHPHVPSEPHDPRLTILVVIGLSLLLTGCAIFLAVCRGSTSWTEEDSHGGCVSGESLVCGPSLSSEPQLKLWKRLGSVRRSFTSSFRRPPQRRPDRSNQCSLTRTELDQISSPTPHLTMPCLFDYVTEI